MGRRDKERGRERAENARDKETNWMIEKNYKQKDIGTDKRVKTEKDLCKDNK